LPTALIKRECSSYDCGCEIVTVPHDILNKALKLSGMDLKELSLDTVKMFANDAKVAGFSL
jgi:transaldolase